MNDDRTANAASVSYGAEPGEAARQHRWCVIVW